MPKNKIFNKYLENEYNKDTIYNKIHLKIESRNIFKKKFVNSLVSIFVIVLFVTTGSAIYAKKNWDKEYNEYINRQINATKATINTEVHDNVQNLSMDYVFKDNLGIKVNSLSLTEYNCQLDIDFKVPEKYKNNFKAFEFGFAIYDNENNIYVVDERTKFGAGEFLYYEKKLCKELGLKYDSKKGLPRNLTTGIKLNPLLIADENYVMRLELNSKQSLPKTNKLYIRIFDVGYTLSEQFIKENSEIEINNAEDFVLSNSEWQFEIEIPDKFYNRNYTDLKFSENIEGIHVNSIKLSSEGNLIINLRTNYSVSDIVAYTYISDEDGNIYTLSNIYDSSQMELLFKINAEDVTNKKLYFNIKSETCNIDKTTQLIKK